jgi:hypothetical protein
MDRGHISSRMSIRGIGRLLAVSRASLASVFLLAVWLDPPNRLCGGSRLHHGHSLRSLVSAARLRRDAELVA